MEEEEERKEHSAMYEEPSCRLHPFSTERETLNSLCFRDWMGKQKLSSGWAPQAPLYFCSFLLLQPFYVELKSCRVSIDVSVAYYDVLTSI